MRDKEKKIVKERKKELKKGKRHDWKMTRDEFESKTKTEEEKKEKKGKENNVGEKATLKKKERKKL